MNFSWILILYHLFRVILIWPAVCKLTRICNTYLYFNGLIAAGVRLNLWNCIFHSSLERICNECHTKLQTTWNIRQLAGDFVLRTCPTYFRKSHSRWTMKAIPTLRPVERAMIYIGHSAVSWSFASGVGYTEEAECRLLLAHQSAV